MFETVTDIDVLVTRQTMMNTRLLEPLESHQASHQGIDFADIIPSILDRFSDGIPCPDCDCPQVIVESKSKAARVRVCRECISAIKLASLIHKDPRTICYACKIKFSPNGVVAGALHTGIYIEDRMRPSEESDGAGILIKGWKTKITETLVEIDLGASDCDVLVHDLTHDADHHCRGCGHVRHPGCAGAGVCHHATSVT